MPCLRHGAEMLGALPAEPCGLPKQWGRLQRTESPLLQARLTSSRVHVLWAVPALSIGTACAIVAAAAAG